MLQMERKQALKINFKDFLKFTILGYKISQFFYNFDQISVQFWSNFGSLWNRNFGQNRKLKSCWNQNRNFGSSLNFVRNPTEFQ